MSSQEFSRLPTGRLLRSHLLERTDAAVLRGQVETVANSPITSAVLRAADGVLMVLNTQAQIVAANTEQLARLDPPGPGRVIGLRLGEALGCANAAHGPGGCGTSPACCRCEGLLAILQAQETNNVSDHECVIPVERQGGCVMREFRIRTSRVTIAGLPLTVVYLRDISEEKRREVLERIFFHDLMNAVGGLYGLACLLQSPEPNIDRQAAADQLVTLTRALVQEIEDQRAFLEAERGELVPEFRTISPGAILELVRQTMHGYAAQRGRTLQVDDSPEGELVTCPSLLVRVLANMVKNALEAAPEGTVVRVWWEPHDDQHLFQVRNRGTIPPEVAARIFQRSFSTKGPDGRGLGTYSMKLFGERYLEGKVSFSSSDTGETTFCILLPAVPQATFRGQSDVTPAP